MRARKLVAPSLHSNLRKTLDPQGIIRIKPSLGNCQDLRCENKFPILLPSNSPFINLIIVNKFSQLGHMINHYTRAKLRNKFWIPKDTGPINSVLGNCKVCEEPERSRRYHVPGSPDLPQVRFDIRTPWRGTHLDVTGQNFVIEENPGELSLDIYLVNKRICWEFLPMGDPYFISYRERVLGVLKSITPKAVGEKLLILDQLMTVAS